jgi:hypothetical protein
MSSRSVNVVATVRVRSRLMSVAMARLGSTPGSCASMSVTVPVLRGGTSATQATPSTTATSAIPVQARQRRRRAAIRKWRLTSNPLSDVPSSRCSGTCHEVSIRPSPRACAGQRHFGVAA